MSASLESTFINQKTGLFKELVPVESFIRPIELYMYTPVYSLKPDSIETHTNPLSISGAGLSQKEAREKCLGEALERYCWYYAGNWVEQIHTSFSDIKDTALPPGGYTLFSNRQYAQKGFPFVPFQETTQIDWAQGIRLDDQEPVSVPSQLCFPTTNDSSRICYYTTTGLACSDNYHRALVTALCEVIERDAFMLMWLNKIKPHLIEIECQEPSPIKTIAEFLKTSKYRCLVFRLDHEITIPVCMAVLVNQENESPYVAFGLACNFDITQAISKSIVESLHNLNFLLWAHHNNISIDWKKGKMALKTFDDHALLYANPQMRRRLSFIFDPPHAIEKIRLPSLEKDDDHKNVFQTLMAMILENGYRAVAVDLTPDEFRKRGYHVIKALIPQFIDLGFSGYNCLGTKRIFESPQKWGFPKLNRKKLNTFPHPFP